MDAQEALKRSGVLLYLLAVVLISVPAASAEPPPYEFSPELSLTADPACQTSAIDPVADPGCPYPPPPAGPTERFNEPRAITFDLYGNEYVLTAGGASGRVLVFDDEGFFITEFVTPSAWSIAVDSKGNVYTFAATGQVFRTEPSAHDPEAGEIAYINSPVEITKFGPVGALAVDRFDDHLLITRPNVIFEYGSAEEVEPTEANKLLDTYEPEKLGNWSQSIAVDAQRRRIYISYCKADFKDCGVLALNADNPEEELAEITGGTTPAGDFLASFAALGIAVDEELGYFFVQDFEVNPSAIYQFDENYEYLSRITDSRFPTTVLSLQIAVSNGERPPNGSGEDAFNRHFLFIPIPPGGQVGNRALAYEPPPPAPETPMIERVSVAGIGETQAQLQAMIDPRGSETEYSFYITTQASFEAEGFEGAELVGKGSIPATALATQVSVPVSGLVPGETYRFKAVAESVIGKAEEEGQNEATFTTYSDSPISSAGCSNLALRTGPSGRLPDCRAYELVTPPDTNGRPPQGVGFIGDTFTTLHTSPSGNEVYFKILGGSLPGTSGVASFEGDPYVTTRGAEGWSTALAGPTGAEATDGLLGSPSSDMGYSFWTAINEGPLVLEKGLTHYLRYPDGDLELTGRGSIDTDPRAVGRLITEDATHVIFETRSVAPDEAVQLEPDAPPTGTAAVYDRTIDPITGAEETHTVSLLPGDDTPNAEENATYKGASKDGEGIAFVIRDNPLSPGILYLRVGNQATYEVGEGVKFAGVSEGGARIFYVEGGDLKALDTTGESPEGEVIDFTTSGDVIPVNVATQGTRAYFVSPSLLDGTNPQGDSAVAPASGQGTLGAKGTGTLSTAKGEGTLTAETKQVTGVSTSEGTFEKGMRISGTGIPAGTTIAAVGAGTLTLSNAATQSGSTALTAGSVKVTGVSTSEGTFEKGMRISGTGIPAGTTIAAVGAGTLTLSNAATQSGSTALTAGSVKVTGVSTSEGTFRVGMNITATGIPAGTIITAIDEGAQTLTLSREASASGVQGLSAFAQNLYLSEEGQISFIATVTARDVEGEPLPKPDDVPSDGLGLWTEVLPDFVAKDPSRLNPSGSVLLFQSRANITGYEESEFPQIYRYDSIAGRLHCISCIPTRTSANGSATLQTISFNSETPPPLSPSGFVSNLTPSGSRVFFESDEALVSSDTDEVQDVYEWEEKGVGSCNEQGGCLYLISSGASERDNFLYAHSTSGDDVFFSTSDILNGFDGGATPSIYDARVGGGFAREGAIICNADACRPSVTPSPTLPIIQSSTQGRSGNLEPKKTRPCPKGKRKVKKKNGKTVCVKKKKGKNGKANKRAGANRRAGK